MADPDYDYDYDAVYDEATDNEIEDEEQDAHSLDKCKECHTWPATFTCEVCGKKICRYCKRNFDLPSEQEFIVMCKTCNMVQRRIYKSLVFGEALKKVTLKLIKRHMSAEKI